MKGSSSKCAEEGVSASVIRRRKVMSCEAPAKLGTGLCKTKSTASPLSSASSEPIDIKTLKETSASTMLLQKKSFSTDIDRDEAWERKRDLFLVDELDELEDEKMQRNLGRSASDCGGRTWPAALKQRSKARTRSLTDEDLEELRGSIDLGFGFNYDESFDLRSTLPALDLYCAITRQYNDMKSRSSPVSPLEGTSLQRSSSVDSYGSPLSDTWRISSPGDNPNQVKTRLRHWAQAVACSIRQGSF